jgi:hypothetical protein
VVLNFVVLNPAEYGRTLFSEGSPQRMKLGSKIQGMKLDFLLLRKFRDTVSLLSCSGLYSGLYGQNLPYKFKKSYGDF